MPLALDELVKDRVRRLWFSGETREKIAAECGIGAGSVTNIVKELNEGLERSEYEVIRQLAVHLKKEELTLNELTSRARLHNYIKNLGADEDRIERFIAACVDSHEPGKIMDVANQVLEMSKSESIPFTDFPKYIRQKCEEKQTLEHEIN